MSNDHSFPATGFLRLADIVGPGRPIPIGKSTWWKGVKSGQFPQPIKLGARTTVWRVEDIRALIKNGPFATPSDPNVNEANCADDNA